MKVKTILALHATILETLFQLAASMNETLQEITKDCSDIHLLLLVTTWFRGRVICIYIVFYPVKVVKFVVPRQLLRR